MKFLMKMPFTVRPGPMVDGWYTAQVLDMDGRILGIAYDDATGRSKASQARANELAMKAARKWAQRVRLHAGC